MVSSGILDSRLFYIPCIHHHHAIQNHQFPDNKLHFDHLYGGPAPLHPNNRVMKIFPVPKANHRDDQILNAPLLELLVFL
uniref:Uncharacterized protein n=1 Tax=uncultured marine virus TaxID=186617 RepID=A0A0F7L3P4_9VIRU|nr:hypothetical protein [uncultured marine virus]